MHTTLVFRPALKIRDQDLAPLLKTWSVTNCTDKTDRSKQCHSVQFAQSASLSTSMNLGFRGLRKSVVFLT